MRMGGVGTFTPPPSFTGLLDLVPNAAAAYSVARKLRAAYAGSAIRLREDAGNTEMDFGFTGANFETDVAAIAAWLILNGATNAYVTKIYDQSGNTRDASQGTAGNQPLYTASAWNGKPGVTFAATDKLSITSFNLATFSIFVSQKSTPVTTEEQFFLFHTDNRQVSYRNTATNRISLYDGANNPVSSVLAVGRSVQSLLEYIGNNPTISFFQNGVASGTGTVGAGMKLNMMGSQDGGAFVNGFMLDTVIYDLALSAGNRQTVETNINAFYALY